MLVSDRDLRKLLPQLAFETDERDRPFDPERQIQPSSIDLRLDRYVWIPIKPKRRRFIDFRHDAAHGELDVKRLFLQRSYRLGEGIRLRPGEMMLGRTFEKFQIPNGFAGKLEGRSTFVRLGLSIHCTGDFINPGWSGRMPLQIVNHGRVPIILTPYLEICQLLLVQTTTPSDNPYGSVLHKYTNDAGGPSRYWLDRSIAQLQEACGIATLPDKMTEAFLEASGGGDSQMIDRFRDFIYKLRRHEHRSAREVLEAFADRDTRRYQWKRRATIILRWLLLLPAGASLGAILKKPYGPLNYCLWVIAVVLAPFGLWALVARDPAQAFTRKEVDQYFANKV